MLSESPVSPASPLEAARVRPESFACRRRGGRPGATVLLEVIGELDVATAPVLTTTVRDAGCPLVVLDLRRLQFMDAAGVHAILDAGDRARRDGRRLVVVPASPRVHAILELTGAGGQIELLDATTTQPLESASRLGPSASGGDGGAHADRCAAESDRAAAASDQAAADADQHASDRGDLVADARDRAAELRDQLVRRDAPGSAAVARERASKARMLAAADRLRAAADREQAAADRLYAEAVLTDAHLDELTGTYRRAIGTHVLQRELERARRSGGRMILAFVDVDGLKQVNDRDGHPAGDRLLIDVVEAIRSNLRSYDPIVRFGGDEFVCALTDSDLPDARDRFQHVQGALQRTRGGGSISVGLTMLEDDESLEQVCRRGHRALYEAKHRRQLRRGPSSGHREPDPW